VSTEIHTGQHQSHRVVRMQSFIVKHGRVGHGKHNLRCADARDVHGRGQTERCSLPAVHDADADCPWLGVLYIDGCRRQHTLDQGKCCVTIDNDRHFSDGSENGRGLHEVRWLVHVDHEHGEDCSGRQTAVVRHSNLTTKDMRCRHRRSISRMEAKEEQRHDAPSTCMTSCVHNRLIPL
jgi:hypothetical protein